MAVALAPAPVAAQGSPRPSGRSCAPIGVLRGERDVVEVCPHRVTVRDARTGAERWSVPSHHRLVGIERDEEGEIVVVTVRRSRVPLGATEAPRPASAPAGAAADEEPPPAEPTRLLRAGEHALWTPPRVGGRAVLRAGVDGFVPVGTGGAGMLTIDGAWHFEAPFVLRFGAPLALGASGNGLGGVFAGLGYASAGFDIDWLEISLGAAVTTVNERPRGQATEAFAGLLGLRLGWADGFSAEAQLFFTVDDVGLDLGIGRIRLTLPVSPRGARIVHRADVGRHGVVRVDVGPVFFLEGRGGPGSFALGLFGGFGHLYYQRVCPFGACARAIVVSPSFGIELDWRP